MASDTDGLTRSRRPDGPSPAPRPGPRGLLPLAALALLVEGPLHPYQMTRRFRERHKEYAEGHIRALYRAITELEAGGMVEAVETSREGRRPERTVYRITETGRETLEDRVAAMLEQPPAPEHPSFTVALDLIATLPQGRAETCLRSRVVWLRARLAALDEAMAAMRQQFRLPRVVLLETEHERALAAAELEFVRGLLEDIGAGRLSWSDEALAAIGPAPWTAQPDHAPNREAAASRRPEHRGVPAP